MPDLESLTQSSDHDGIRYIRLGNLTARYMVTGKGSPLLLIHGCPGSVFSWRSNLDELTEHHRVYALDLMGFGESQGPQNTNFTLAAHADFVRRFLQEMGLSKLCLVGHSIGAGIALHVASQLPERISRLVLIGCLGLEPHLVLKLVRVPGVASAILAMTRILPSWLRERFSSTFYHILYNELAPLAAGDVVREGLELTARDVLGSTLRTAQLTNCSRLKAICQLITTPTLMIHGKRDRLVSWRNAVKLSEHLMSSQLELVDGGGHMLHIEQAQHINRLILKFTVPVKSPVNLPAAKKPKNNGNGWLLPEELLATYPYGALGDDTSATIISP